jgi:hypothetical protein
MKKDVERYGEEARLYVFEKDKIKVAICSTPQGGVSVDLLQMYSFDEARGQWLYRVYWDTRVRGVIVSFNEQTGIIEAHSASGRLIFQASLSAFAANRWDKFPLSGLRVDYPSVRTFEEVETAVKADRRGSRLHRFQKGDVEVAVREQSRDEAGGKRIILYTSDEIGDQWSPRVIWDTGVSDVRVTFNKWSGLIEVHSGDRTLIFRANIAALEARPNSFD